MKVTETYVKYSPSGIPSQGTKSYLLYIPDSGPVGDRHDMGPSSTGMQFPTKASERFAFKKDAERVKAAFLKYCYAKMTDAAKGHVHHKNSGVSSERGARNPSYFLWR
jgi:hypothetical protein